MPAIIAAPMHETFLAPFCGSETFKECTELNPLPLTKFGLIRSTNWMVKVERRPNCLSIDLTGAKAQSVFRKDFAERAERISDDRRMRLVHELRPSFRS